MARKSKFWVRGIRSVALFCLLALLPGCAGMSLPFSNDPLTGGVDASQSSLLGISLPLGLQRFPSHGGVLGGGRKEGLEMLRGNVDQTACAQSFYANLKQAGWQLRMCQRVGNRAVYIYEKSGELACIVFQPQGLLTIVEIWRGARLVDNAALPFARHADSGGMNPLPAEEYGPVTESQGNPAKEEKWGLEEKPL